MPSRNSELPEGTDHIVKGAAETGGSRGGGAVATARKDDTGGTARKSGTTAASGSVRDQFGEQIASLKSQAGDKVREYCDQGKGRASDALGEFSQVIEDAARSIDDRIGKEYGDYAHQAADYVSSFAETVRNKDIDTLVDDTRQAVRKSPGIAIAAAAVVGFALVRLLKTGLDDVQGKSGTARSGRTTNVDTGA